MCRGKFFKKTEEIFPTLNLLAGHGYIRLEEPERRSAGRPADIKIIVNPAVWNRIYCIYCIYCIKLCSDIVRSSSSGWGKEGGMIIFVNIWIGEFDLWMLEDGGPSLSKWRKRDDYYERGGDHKKIEIVRIVTIVTDWIRWGRQR